MFLFKKDGKAICGGLSWAQTIGHLQIYIDFQTNLKPEEMDLLQEIGADHDVVLSHVLFAECDWDGIDVTWYLSST